MVHQCMKHSTNVPRYFARRKYRGTMYHGTMYHGTLYHGTCSYGHSGNNFRLEQLLLWYNGARYVCIVLSRPRGHWRDTPLFAF